MNTNVQKVADSIAELILESDNNPVDIDSVIGPEPAVSTPVGDVVKFEMYKHTPHGSIKYEVVITAKYESEED